MEPSQSASLYANFRASGSEAPWPKYGQEQHSSVIGEEAEWNEAFAEPLKVAPPRSVANSVVQEPVAGIASFEHGEGAAEQTRAADSDGKLDTGVFAEHQGLSVAEQQLTAESVEVCPEVATDSSKALPEEANTWTAMPGSVQTGQLASLSLHSPAGSFKAEADNGNGSGCMDAESAGHSANVDEVASDGRCEGFAEATPNGQSAHSQVALPAANLHRSEDREPAHCDCPPHTGSDEGYDLSTLDNTAFKLAVMQMMQSMLDGTPIVPCSIIGAFAALPQDLKHLSHSKHPASEQQRRSVLRWRGSKAEARMLARLGVSAAAQQAQQVPWEALGKADHLKSRRTGGTSGARTSAGPQGSHESVSNATSMADATLQAHMAQPHIAGLNTNADKGGTHTAAAPPATLNALQAAQRGIASPSAAIDSLRSHYTVNSLNDTALTDTALAASAARRSMDDAASDNPFNPRGTSEAWPASAGISGDAIHAGDGLARASSSELQYSSGDSWLAAPQEKLQAVGSGQQAPLAGAQVASVGEPAHAAAPPQSMPGNAFSRADPSSQNMPKKWLDLSAASMLAAEAPQLHAGQCTGHRPHTDAGPVSARSPMAPVQLSADPSSDTLPTLKLQQAAEEELEEDEWDDFAWPEVTGHAHTEAAHAPGAAAAASHVEAGAVRIADAAAPDHANRSFSLTLSMEGHPGWYAQDTVEQDALNTIWIRGEGASTSRHDLLIPDLSFMLATDLQIPQPGTQAWR